MTRIRNTFLLGITGLGAASAIALGPVNAAHASETPAVNPAGTNPTAAAPVAPADKQLDTDRTLQPNGYYCGPAASRIALSAHGTPPSFDALAHEMGTTTDGTKSIDDITRVLNQHEDGRYASVKLDGNITPEQTDTLRTDVVASVNDGDPVVAHIVGQVSDTHGETHRYAGGHYLTITGYTNDGHTVTITDPADSKGSNQYQLNIDDMAGWMATRGYTH